MTADRLIALEGAVNFRDLGGYRTTDGHQTRWRVLFRADGLGELTGDDLEMVKQLGIRTVVDLRSSYEVESGRFDTEAHPVAFHHLPFIDELPHPEVFERTPGFLGSLYKDMLDDAGPQIIKALEALTTPGACPAVFHCTAGKDRTGLLAALVLSLVGVPEETVVADYALSGEAMARLKAKLVRKYPDGKEAIENAQEAFSVDPDHMVRLLAHLRERHGTVHEYAAKIGVSEHVVARLREELLETAPVSV